MRQKLERHYKWLRAILKPKLYWLGKIIVEASIFAAIFAVIFQIIDQQFVFGVSCGTLLLCIRK